MITQYTFVFNQETATIDVKSITPIVIANVKQEARDSPACEHLTTTFAQEETETPARPPLPVGRRSFYNYGNRVYLFVFKNR